MGRFHVHFEIVGRDELLAADVARISQVIKVNLRWKQHRAFFERIFDKHR